MTDAHILVVDDEPGVRSALEGVLADEGFRVTAVESGEAGIEALTADRFDAVMLDVWLPGMDGLDTLQKLRERGIETQVVMISGHGNIETAVRATKLGAFDFVEKPLSLEKTLLVLRNALRQGRLERTNRQLLGQLSRDTEIVGSSAAAERLRREVELALEVQSPVLICGEPDSGREMLARRIHGTGTAAEAPFVEVPCSALEARAVEAALYGSGNRPGRLRLAEGGTLFLEDVDRMPPASQQRLAASLDDDETGFRAMASAPPAARGLDPSLLHRLDVIRIEVPALRERRDDVPLLAERYMRELSREYGREARRLAPDVLDALKAYGWPGNVRELRNLVERVVLFAAGEVVELRDLPEKLGGARTTAADLYGEFASLQDGVKAFERYYVAKIMTDAGGDVAAAADRLGVTRATLRKRLKNL